MLASDMPPSFTIADMARALRVEGDGDACEDHEVDGPEEEGEAPVSPSETVLRERSNQQ